MQSTCEEWLCRVVVQRSFEQYEYCEDFKCKSVLYIMFSEYDNTHVVESMSSCTVFA